MYEIDSGMRLYKIDKWIATMSNELCGEIAYFATSENGSPLPPTVSFDQNSLVISISTSSIYDEKTIWV